VAIGSALITTLTFIPLLSSALAIPPTAMFVGLGVLCLTGLALLSRMPGVQPAASAVTARAHAAPGAGRPETGRLSRPMVIELLLLSAAGVLGLSVANGVLAWLPAYLETAMGFAKSRVAIVMGLLTATQIVSAYAAGTITDRMRDRVPIAVWGTILQGIGCAGLLWASEWTIWPLVVIVGVGFAWAITPMTLLVAEYFGAARAGVTTSFTVAISQTGSGLAAALFGWIAEAAKGFAGVWIFSVALAAARLALFAARGKAWSRGRPSG
jgi:predicted MFS family arabinose efflux permease